MVNRSSAATRLLLVVCVCAWALPGSAQTSTYPPPASVEGVDQASGPEPAHVAYIDGAVTVTHDGRSEAAVINVPLIAGDQLRSREGRAEALFGDGSVLDADQFTAVDFLSDELMRLLEGRVRLTIRGRDRVAYRIDTPSAAVRIESPGEYRISLVGESGRTDVELVTTRGYATLVNELGETAVRAGERAFATRGMAPSYAQAYNSARWDAFDGWAADRRQERTGETSARYLPDEMRGYAGDFDRYGDWQYDVSYGYVWYPRVVVDWRPYYFGRWNYYRPWGWTWIAYDRWGWPTHHYGRWGFRAGVWFWIPSRHWAPAYVYWAGASDYIGWCPLGWDNRPIFNIININIGIGRGYRGYDPYRAWTVVPRHAFRPRVDVRRYAVARGDIDRAVPRWYVSGASAPLRPSVDDRGGRNAAPIYSAGRASVARAPAPRARGDAGITPQRTYGSGATPSGWAAQPDRAVSRGAAREADGFGSRGGIANSAPEANVPRATPPASAGALGAPGAWPRARSRDLGPGGPEVRGAPSENDDRGGVSRAVPRMPVRTDPGEVERGSRSRIPDGRVYAPRGVPEGGVYGPRGVPSDPPRAIPRSGPAYVPSRPENAPAPTYQPPMRRRPEGYGGGGAYTPRPSSERPSTDRPSYGRAPSGPGPSGPGPSADRPRGGSEGRDRAAPRGGGSAPPSRPGGGHPRTRPQ